MTLRDPRPRLGPNRETGTRTVSKTNLLHVSHKRLSSYSFSHPPLPPGPLSGLLTGYDFRSTEGFPTVT